MFEQLHQDDKKTTIFGSYTLYNKRNMETFSKMIDKYRQMSPAANTNSYWGGMWHKDLEQDLKVKLEDELSQFEDKQAMKEIILHEQMNKEKERKEREEHLQNKIRKA